MGAPLDYNKLASVFVIAALLVLLGVAIRARRPERFWRTGTAPVQPQPVRTQPVRTQPVARAGTAGPTTSATKRLDGEREGLPFVKVEVKSKATTAVPKENYENSVSAFNADQAADVYVFLRVQWESPLQKDLGGKLWFCGFVPCSEFKQRARRVEKGARDGDNGYVCRSNCWNIPISQCGTWADFVRYLDKGTDKSVV